MEFCLELHQTLMWLRKYGDRLIEFQLQVSFIAGRENFGRTLVTVKMARNGCILKKHSFLWMKLVVFDFDNLFP